MKKNKLRTFLLASIALVLTATAAKGQDSDEMVVSIRGAISGSPITAKDYFARSYSYNYYNSLSTYYGDYYGPSYTSGAITLGADIRLLKWFAIGLDINTTPIWHDRYHKDDSKVARETGVALTILPMAKFYYFRRPIVMLYGRLGMGFGKYFNFSSLQYNYRDSNGARHFVDESFKFEAQFVPFGIEVGKKVFWYAELGVGTVYIGGQTGIGYRF